MDNVLERFMRKISPRMEEGTRNQGGLPLALVRRSSSLSTQVDRHVSNMEVADIIIEAR
jgi:hypothetical protein